MTPKSLDFIGFLTCWKVETQETFGHEASCNRLYGSGEGLDSELLFLVVAMCFL